MNSFENILNGFETIGLENMKDVQLLDRLDIKYTMNLNELDELLNQCNNDYYVVDINGVKNCTYLTEYYDTANYSMYLAHHQGKQNRYKIRFRTYVDSALKFFEIKFKSNKGMTFKSRVKTHLNATMSDTEVKELLNKKTNFVYNDLHKAIVVQYNRITLVNKSKTERITIDTNLTFQLAKQEKTLHNLVIVELKKGRETKSTFIEVAKSLKLKTGSLSKYALGIALLANGIKNNLFKTKIKYVESLSKAS